jgi:hypothetical protein
MKNSRNWLNRLIGMFLVYTLITPLSAVALITHNSKITLIGTGFKIKLPTAPWRSSFMHQTKGQNFQATGVFSSFWEPCTAMVDIADTFYCARVRRSTHKYYTRLEYSQKGNYGQPGYSAGMNMDLPQTGYDYVAWWEYWEPGFKFSDMSTGNGNIKWVYYGVGSTPAREMQINNNGENFWAIARGGVAGSTSEEIDNNLILPLGGRWYSKGSSWLCPRFIEGGTWNLIEIFDKMNSSQGIRNGWSELRINNQTIYRVNNIDNFGSTISKNKDFSSVRLGGNYGFTGNGVYYRYMGDIYADGTFARIVVGECANFNDCRHLELQIPLIWKDTCIQFTFNQGTFKNTDSLYLYIVDSENKPSSPIPFMVGGESELRIPIRKSISTNISNYSKSTNLLTSIFDITGRKIHYDKLINSNNVQKNLRPGIYVVNSHSDRNRTLTIMSNESILNQKIFNRAVSPLQSKSKK